MDSRLANEGDAIRWRRLQVVEEAPPLASSSLPFIAVFKPFMLSEKN